MGREIAIRDPTSSVAIITSYLWVVEIYMPLCAWVNGTTVAREKCRRPSLSHHVNFENMRAP